MHVCLVMSSSLQTFGLWPSRLLSPWDSPGKNIRGDCHALLQRIFLTQDLNPCLLCLLHWLVGSLPAEPLCVCVLSRVQLFETLWTIAHQAPLSMGLSRQEYWNGLPCPPPGDLPDPGSRDRAEKE